MILNKSGWEELLGSCKSSKYPNLYIGVDPGATGAIAAITDDGRAAVVDLPGVAVNRSGKTKKTKKNRTTTVMDCTGVVNLFADAVASWTVHLMVETALISRQGGMADAYSAYRLCKWYAPWELFAAVYLMRFAEVSPGVWKKAQKLLKAEKAVSVRMATQRWPGLLSGVESDHNRAEALLLAEYGRLYVWK